jgi:membrane protease YdiL (CAAX protease family)
MWCPGIAALLTCKLRKIPYSELGWRWPKTKYVFLGYFVPIAYSLTAYLAVWILGYGKFYNPEYVTHAAKGFGWNTIPAWLVIALTVLFTGTLGILRSTTSALGEEIGWRGFLVPQMMQRLSFTKTALITGVIWGLWHYPALLLLDYNSGTPAWYGLTCFTIAVVSISFAFAWIRMKSGSLWPAAIMHASHNLFIQSILTPITAETNLTKYAIDEFGAALPTVCLIVAILFWRKRSEVERATSRVR